MLYFTIHTACKLHQAWLRQTLLNIQTAVIDKLLEMFVFIKMQSGIFEVNEQNNFEHCVTLASHGRI